MSRRSRTCQQAATTAILVLGSLVLLPGNAGAAEPECEGQPATIAGTTGPDVLYGTPANDVVWLGGETGSTGEDVFVDPFGGADLICQGGPGSAHIQAGPGDDSVYVADGATVYGGSGADRIEGGQGPSRVISFGGPGDDVLIGSAGGDRLFGGDGDDAAQGFENSDVIDGGDGNDQIDAGPHDDLVTGSQGSDAVDAGAGADHLAFSAKTPYRMITQLASGVSIDLSAGTVTSDTGTTQVSGVECWTGTPYADTIDGTSGPDCIDGADGGGADTIRALGGDDDVTIYFGSADGGDGNDELVAGQQRHGEPADQATTVELSGGSGDDALDMVSRVVRALGGDGDDIIRFAFAFDGAAEGGGDEDTFVLSRNGDLDAREGVSTFLWSDITHRVTFGGMEVFVGARGPDVMLGSGADEVFTGGGGRDQIRGRGGDDHLNGGKANDDLSGGKGTDVAVGGKGNDRCTAETERSCEGGR
jgi:Ca2+-binding RTX toxin-like protein